jgi:putative ABC transport system permease protein
LGIVDAKAWLEGAVYLDRQLYERHWQDHRIRLLAIDLHEETNPEIIKSQIERVASDQQPLFVETAIERKRASKDVVVRNIDRFFMFFYVQMFIVSFVAAIGIINTLVISVWDRRREIGIMRAVGGTRGQIGRMVLLEAAVIGLIGLTTGVVKGVFDAYFMSRTAAAVFGGYSIPFNFPGALVLASAPIMIAVALGAAWWPARLASKTNVLEAIGSE